MDDQLVSALANLEVDRALALVREQVDAGRDPAGVLEACRQGMHLVGERFEAGLYFVSELIVSAAIFGKVTLMLEPTLARASCPVRGTVVIGTVRGDIHDIGKNLVVILLKAAGYEVHDLGVNVPPHRFVETLQETGGSVVGLSGLLTTAFGSMRETVAALDAAGLRPRVKVMIGGGPVTEQVRVYAGADAWGADAQAAVTLCNRWIEDG